MTKEKQCPKCKSKNLSKVGSDFIYSITEQREIPIQYCNDCHAEWFVKEEKIMGERFKKQRGKEDFALGSTIGRPGKGMSVANFKISELIMKRDGLTLFSKILFGILGTILIISIFLWLVIQQQISPIVAIILVSALGGLGMLIIHFVNKIMNELF